MKPYYEKILSENVTIRGFSDQIDPERLTWHRDEENRIIIVVEGGGWLFQRENKIPFLMEVGDRIKVNANEYHRIIKGKDDLIVTIIKRS
jgi:quercetin dioxygenase-like cupin family protein